LITCCFARYIRANMMSDKPLVSNASGVHKLVLLWAITHSTERLVAGTVVIDVTVCSHILLLQLTVDMKYMFVA